VLEKYGMGEQQIDFCTRLSLGRNDEPHTAEYPQSHEKQAKESPMGGEEDDSVAIAIDA